jgi:hypothetical protein
VRNVEDELPDAAAHAAADAGSEPAVEVAAAQAD